MVRDPSTAAASPSATIQFEAADVTGTHTAVADVQRSLPASAVVDSLVKQMALPENVPYALRDDTTGAFLDDQQAIGDQMTDGHVTLTPKTHLG
ncbi:MAG: hypothetical protein QGG36_09635 [Pirellulaceae bacterium]|jgi:hypothetical protein|nr:hypothetical protein [Pirellulaceae bacterium]